MHLAWGVGLVDGLFTLGALWYVRNALTSFQPKCLPMAPSLGGAMGNNLGWARLAFRLHQSAPVQTAHPPAPYPTPNAWYINKFKAFRAYVPCKMWTWLGGVGI